MLRMRDDDWDPLFHVTCTSDVCRFQHIDDLSHGVFRFMLKGNYFNNYIGCWEPFLEKTSFSLSYYKNTSKGTVEQVTLSSQFGEDGGDEHSKSLIEISLTDTMVI